MANDNVTKAMKVISTISLGHLAGITSFKFSSIQPALEEQDNVTAASRMMASMLKRSLVLPVATIISSTSGMVVYCRLYGTANKDGFYLVSSLLLAGLIPYTFKFIRPINEHFLECDETFEGNDEKWKTLLVEWRKWHLPRSIICASLFSVAVYKLVF